MPPDGPLAPLLQPVSISIPRVLHHDAEHHVLVFEDLGPLLTLDRYLAAFSREASQLSAAAEKACEQIGARLGGFFGELHSPRSLRLVLQSASHDLANVFTRDLVYEFAVLPVRGHLEKYAIQDPGLLFARVQQDYERALVDGEPCFVLGDFTPGAVLLGRSGDGSQKMGVIDWEFSCCEGRGPNGDMAQCLAALHVSLLASPAGSDAFLATRALVRGMCSAYSRHLAGWLPETRPRGNPPNEPLVLHLFRSALILHGREIINHAVDGEWPPSFSVADAVGLGAWYLRVAGSDVQDMIQEANWQQLLKEDHRMMLNLFNL